MSNDRQNDLISLIEMLDKKVDWKYFYAIIGMGTAAIVYIFLTMTDHTSTIYNISRDIELIPYQIVDKISSECNL